jgi:hypothetical protein
LSRVDADWMVMTKIPERVTDVLREDFLKKLAMRDLYEIIRMFDGQPDGSTIELGEEGLLYTREEIGGEIYRRGRIVPPKGE